MREFELVGEVAPPPWWRSLLWAGPTSFLGLVGAVYSPLAWSMQDAPAGSAVLAMALVLALALVGPFALFWRHRYPFRIALGAAAAALVLPVGSSLSLMALATLIGRRRGPAVGWTIAAVAVSTAFAATVDALDQPRGASFLKSTLGGQGLSPVNPETLPAIDVGLFVLVVLGLAVGLGLMVRARREAAVARGQARSDRAASTRLGDEAARRQERERIAREVHDALGHRLSLLTLHAGALEANAQGDERLAGSARLVRESATAAMADLRSLLTMLRDPIGESTPQLSLAHLADVVRESFGAGQALSTSIVVQDPDAAHPTLARAVYRIVQEVLTNARRHAPGQGVLLIVEGSPATGLTIDCRNRFVGNAAPEVGGSRGLTGIAERVELLGGSVQHGLDDGGLTFRVRVVLPWLSA